MSRTPFAGVPTAGPIPHQTAVTEPLFTLNTPPQKTKTSKGADISSAEDRARVAALLLDDLLFAAPVFCIDSGNSKVVTDRPLKFLSEAADLVRSGKAASYVATLRESAVAVDIDGDDEDWSTSALEHLTHHAEELGGWYLTRRSGGGAGRWHLIACFRSQAARDAFKAIVDTVRAHWGATARQIDWRRTLRPLSAPHRKTGRVELPEFVEGAANTLPSWAMNMPRYMPRPATLRKETPVTPWHRSLSTIPSGEFWERLRNPGVEYYVDRSLSELLSTARLVIAGFDDEAAWKVVQDPHHRGFARSRQRGHRWWVKFCWNEAVEYVDSQRGSHTGKSPAERWKRVTGPLLAGVRKLHWESWTPATRHSGERVLAAIGDRMARQGLGCRPLPQRDLENDTGQSRNTISKALRQFVKDGVLVKTRTYHQSMGTKASDEYSLNLLALDFRAEKTEPPCSHTPAPRSRSWFSLATTLALHPGPLTVTQLFHLTGYTPTPQPTRSQLENVSTGLAALRKLRVAKETKRGWQLTGQAAREVRSMKQRKATTAARIERERRAFKGVWEETRRSLQKRWEEQKERALQKRAAADQNRREAWWASLTAEERKSRRDEWKASFRELTPAQQKARIAELRERRYMARWGAAA